MMHSYDDFCNKSSMGSIFLQNIQVFLEKQAERKTCNIDIATAPNVRSCWFVILAFDHNDENYKIPLYIFEEDHGYVDDNTSTPLPTCIHCRGAGWGRDSLSRQNYHFIIPTNGEFTRPDDEKLKFEKALGEGRVMDVSNCILYGLIHGNGYGHLITIRRDESCEFLSGSKIMGLWDRICTHLGTRKISLRDEAKKGPMDLRLLYAVALKGTWFGEWEYSFCRGGFGVTEARYEEALQSLKSLTLEEIIENCDDDRRNKVERIIKHYRGRSRLVGELRTIKDLFERMLIIMFSQGPTMEKRSLAAAAYSFYDPSSEPELEESEATVARKIVDTLKLNKRKRREYSSSDWTKGGDLKKVQEPDSAQAVDKVLKKIDGKRVGDYIIHRRKTSCYEFKVDAVGVPGCNIYSDIIYMYEHVFVTCPSDSVKLATRVVLDTKQYGKEYTRIEEESTIICQMLRKQQPSQPLNENDHGDRFLGHGEILIAVSPGATIGNLKQQACRDIKKTYCLCAAPHFVVEQIVGYNELEDTSLIPEELVIRSREDGVGLALTVEPSGSCLTTYQGGIHTWKGGQDAVINCTECGAQEDDGELMEYCIACSKWKHQRCDQLHLQDKLWCLNCDSRIFSNGDDDPTMIDFDAFLQQL